MLVTASASALESASGGKAGDALSIAGSVASPLLAIDRNREAVVERIVTKWGGALAQANAGIMADQLREMLLGMRADQLLAASLVGSLDGLLDVIATSLVRETEVKAPLLQEKALGDANQDVTYVPVTPCRLVETRGTFAAVYQGGGSFATNEIRTYTLQGGNGVCLSQLPASISPSAVQMQVYGIPTTTGSGDIEILPQGGTFGSTATLVYLGNNAFTSASSTSLANLGNKQISVQVRGGGAHVAIDVVGYFRPPQGGFVTSVATGAGLTGGPITSTGTINLATTQLLPTAACATNQVVRWNGSAWVCATPTTGLSAYGSFSNDSGPAIAVIIGGTSIPLPSTSVANNMNVAGAIVTLVNSGTYRFHYCIRTTGNSGASSRLVINGSAINASIITPVLSRNEWCRATMLSLISTNSTVQIQLFGLIGAVTLLAPGGAELVIERLNP